MQYGNVLVVAADLKTAEEAIAAGRRPETVRGHLRPDCILEVKQTGKTTGEIVWRWNAWDHLVQDVDRSKPNYGDISEHPERIDVNFSTQIMAAAMADPRQVARLRALGYIGGGGTRPGTPPRRRPTWRRLAAGRPAGARRRPAAGSGESRTRRRLRRRSWSWWPTSRRWWMPVPRPSLRGRLSRPGRAGTVGPRMTVVSRRPPCGLGSPVATATCVERQGASRGHPRTNPAAH